ncbi:hypothetical protein MHU86_7756 [Fragilaria crotonensis]|nr:hypothetical protein MHU86_7756 [Fragilaria crotonensis]
MSSANDTNDAAEVMVPSQGSSIPHAEGAAEAVAVASNDTAIPMAAAILLDQPPPQSSSNGKRFDSSLSNNNGSIRETIVLHDPNRRPNDATSLETTVLQVEMDGELDAFYDENANGTATNASIEETDPGTPGHAWRSVNGVFHKRKWIKITIIVIMVLISIIIPVTLTALHDENSSIPMNYSWSIHDGGLPPLPSHVSRAGADDLATLEDCYTFCEIFSDDIDPIVGLAYYFDGALSTIDRSQAVCLCYQSIPCVRIMGDRREGIVKSAFPLPGKCDIGNSSFPNGNETRGL